MDLESEVLLVGKEFQFISDFPSIKFSLPETHPNRFKTSISTLQSSSIRVNVINTSGDKNHPPAPAWGCICGIELFDLSGAREYPELVKGGWTGLDSLKMSRCFRRTGDTEYEGLDSETDTSRSFGPNDLLPFEGCYVDIGSRVDGEDVGFLWTDQSYNRVFSGVRFPKIEKGTHLIRLSILGRNVATYTVFRLVNEDEFKGEPASTEEVNLLSHVHVYLPPKTLKTK